VLSTARPLNPISACGVPGKFGIEPMQTPAWRVIVFQKLHDHRVADSDDPRPQIRDITLDLGVAGLGFSRRETR